MSAEATLAKIAAGSDQKVKTEEYKTLLVSLIQSKNVKGLSDFIDHMVLEATPLVISRILLQEVANTLPGLGVEAHTQVAKHAIEKIQPRVVAFEEQISAVRSDLASVYEEDGDWTEAAKALIGIPLDSGQRVLTADYKVSIYVKIAQLFLENEEHFEADRFMTKASVLIPDCKDAHNVRIFKANTARIYEFKRKFLEAAVRYYELSRILESAEEQLHALESSVICAIMAPAGPQRSRQLATLYKDERTSKLEIYSIMQKMFTDRILRKNEVDSFVTFLKNRDFRIAPVDDKTTVLDKAMREHNLLSASKVYLNIRFDELGVLLDMEPEDAERLASTMICEDRLSGHIDQLERVIYFQESNNLMLWDAHIEAACASVNSILDLLTARYPALVDTASKKFA